MKLVSLDLDGTLVHPAIFNVVADALGFGEPLRRTYEAYAAGAMSLEEAFRHDWARFEGRDVALCVKAARRSKSWTPGIEQAVAAMRLAGLQVVVTTDQPRFLAEVALDFGIEAAVASEADVSGGRIPREIDARFAKWPNLEAWLAGRGIHPRDVAHVGNGVNDIPVFQRVGYSVAVNPSSPAVANAADDVVDPLQDLRQVADLVVARKTALL